MTNKHILLVCDADRFRGSGHVMRMITLGTELRSRGIAVDMLAHTIPAQLINRAQRADIRVLNRICEQNSHQLSAEIPTGVYTHIVLDGYEFATVTFEELSRRKEFVIVLDDNGDHAGKPCHLIINQNMHALEDMYKGYSSKQQLLLGPDYVLLRPEVRLEGGLPTPDREGLLLSLGGTDSLELRKHFVDHLGTLKSIPLLIAEGHISRSPTSPSDFANFMRRARVGLIALGTTLWEALYLGLPIVGLVVAENQVLAANSIMQKNLAEIFDVRDTCDFERISMTIAELYESETLLQERSEAGMKIVDGLGSTRVTDYILQL